VSSLSLADVTWSTPDGHLLFSDLSIDFVRERVGLVGRNGVGKSTLLRMIAGKIEPDRGRVSRMGVIGTMRQIVQVNSEERVADLLGIGGDLARLRRAEAGTATLEDLAEVDWTLEAEAEAALASVGLEVPLETPLIALSGGQRTRAALAGAVFGRPDFLLLDEPTNDLDAEGRGIVRKLLGDWRAGAIVVSHDRELLEGMDAIVELTTLGAARYGGNFSAFSERKAVELAAAEHDAAVAQRHLNEVKRRAQQTRERQQRRDAAGARKSARGDMPKILMGARANRAENSGGDNARLAERQRNDALTSLAEARERVERVEPWSIKLASSGLAPGQRVLELRGVNFGHVADKPILADQNLLIAGPERVAVSGANGAGKSTLLALAAGHITPWSGTIRRYAKAAYFDQRMTLLDGEKTILANHARHNPDVDDNGRRAALARFGFRAAAAERRVDRLSGGETLRAALAVVLGGATPPPLLILDEPTNHLDLDALNELETALRAYDGALLVVSHDEKFLQTIGVTSRIDL
jgi:ATPase subunit of ABC transporter with duplicated ATPase domains|tara:strand:- start:1700 stop:3274 length:1575 start_codon:yes stop_codon:yes gene_type:complete